MLDKIFQAARAFLLAEYGEDFLKKNAKFDAGVARQALGRFLFYYFQEEESVGQIIVDGEEAWKSRSKLRSVTVKITMNEGDERDYFAVTIEIFPKNKIYVESLEEIFWGELLSNKSICLTAENYLQLSLTDSFQRIGFRAFKNHPVHEFWS